MTPQEIYMLVAPDLVEVEQELRGYASAKIQPITDIGDHLLDSGGKRIRPALLLLTAKLLGGVRPSDIRLGAVVELIHNATLVHDDIIDAADTRRGRPSANSKWGNSMTVLAGDWLYMQSFAVALSERNIDVLATLIEITKKMVEGELLQLTLLGSADATPDQLLDIVERKTAWLFSGCMKLPALVAGRDAALAGRLADIGRNLGMAFQLVDDLLDLTSTQETLGKPVASDLKEGKLTLPVALAVAEGRPDHVEKIRTVLRDREFKSVRSSEIMQIVEESGSLKQTRKIASDYALKAKALLEEFPASDYRRAILSIPEFILNRTA